MITKGTEQYAAAQHLANQLTRIAAYQRWNNNSMFNLHFNPMASFLEKVKAAGGFAAQVAESVESKMSGTGYCVANLSCKQAWVIACAAIEAGIKQEYITD